MSEYPSAGNGSKPPVSGAGTDQLSLGASGKPTSQATSRGSPLSIEVRLAAEGDLSFIFACWVNAAQAVRNRAVRELEQLKEGLDNSPLPQVERLLRVWDTNWVSAAQHALASRLMDQGLVIVACNPQNHDQLYGYLVTDPGQVAHWLFVKKTFRRWGVARRLMQSAFPGFPDEGPVEVTSRPPVELSSWPLRFRSSHLCTKEDNR